jgi:protease-4
VALKLVDELGGEQAAVAWLAKRYPCEPRESANLTTCIAPDTPVRDFRLRDRFADLPFLHTAAVVLLDSAGLGSFARRIEGVGALQAMERLNLDGLLALWHPPSAD